MTIQTKKFSDVFPSVDKWNTFTQDIQHNYFDTSSELFVQGNTLNFTSEILYRAMYDKYSYRYLRMPEDEFVYGLYNIFYTNYPSLFVKLQPYILNNLSSLQDPMSRGKKYNKKMGVGGTATGTATNKSSSTSTTSSAVANTPTNTKGPSTALTADDGISEKTGMDAISGSQSDSGNTSTYSSNYNTDTNDYDFVKELERIFVSDLAYPLQDFLAEFNQLFRQYEGIIGNTSHSGVGEISNFTSFYSNEIIDPNQKVYIPNNNGYVSVSKLLSLQKGYLTVEEIVALASQGTISLNALEFRFNTTNQNYELTGIQANDLSFSLDANNKQTLSNKTVLLRLDEANKEFQVDIDNNNLLSITSSSIVINTKLTSTSPIQTTNAPTDPSDVITLSHLNPSIYSFLKTCLTAGTNITLTPNDTNNTITITASGGTGAPTQPEIYALNKLILKQGSNVSFNYNDTSNELTINATSTTFTPTAANIIPVFKPSQFSNVNSLIQIQSQSKSLNLVINGGQASWAYDAANKQWNQVSSSWAQTKIYWLVIWDTSADTYTIPIIIPARFLDWSNVIATPISISGKITNYYTIIGQKSGLGYISISDGNQLIDSSTYKFTVYTPNYDTINT